MARSRSRPAEQNHRTVGARLCLATVPALIAVVSALQSATWRLVGGGGGSRRYCRRVSDDALIDEIGSRLAEAAPAQSKIVLFGSRARGDQGPLSDVDVLVIEPSVDDPFKESVRLRRVLRGLGVPIDVVVVSRTEAIRRSAVRGTVIERALREGRVLVET
jgi:predicted nucleotidyltransferase